MKRILSLSLGVTLLLLVVSSVAFARPDTSGDRMYMKQMNQEALAQADNTSSREDTSFLFAASGDGAYGQPGTETWGYTFDDGGSAAPAGFYGVDNTASEGPFWNVHTVDLCASTDTDISFATPFGGGENVYALWCGQENQCGWANPTGYGADWKQWCIIETGGGSSLDLQVDLTHHYEGETWDELAIWVEVDGVLTELDTSAYFHEPVAMSYDDFTLNYAPGGTLGDLVFVFFSDSNTDDETGDFVSNVGAVWLDNIIIDMDAVEVFAADFEDGLVPTGMSFDVPSGAGNYAALYANLFTEDICFLNNTNAWAFFDLFTSNPEYPIPVIAYGPPYIENYLHSPVLELDGNGDPFTLDAETQVWLNTLNYWDLPLDNLIFYKWYVAAKTLEVPCLGPWKSDIYVTYGDHKQWNTDNENVTGYVAESAAGGTVVGIAVRMGAIDMCENWCSVHGSGDLHSPGPFIDNVSVRLISGSAISWVISDVDRFQDNFPEEGKGLVRIDSANNIEPTDSPTVVIGDSTMIECEASLAGGFLTHNNALAGEIRPNIYMWYRIVGGPNEGFIGSETADVDDSDGIYSPYNGTGLNNGEVWMIAVADSAAWQGTIGDNKWAFDLNDEFFEPGDRIEHFYLAETLGGGTETRPGWAMSSDADLRSAYVVRCLPTVGTTLLHCDDDHRRGSWAYWREAFQYNGYTIYDIYSTQGCSSGLQNGLAGRAVLADIEQYEMITWDSGYLSSFTITDEAPEDKVFDSVLIESWIVNSEHQASFWAMGDQIANDLGTGDAFLSDVLGAQLIDPVLNYDDYTHILVPLVTSVHPLLTYLGGEPTFWVDGGCPGIEDFSLVAPTGGAVISHAWPESPSGVVAGIYNDDPDGNGTPLNVHGVYTKALYNPFSYFHVWDAGYGLWAGRGSDYARLSVGRTLQNLFSVGPNGAPDDAPELPAYTRLDGNFPNPFNPKTTIRFSLANAGAVTLQVYDITGRTVATLLDGQNMAAQAHEVVWDGTTNGGEKAASGVYFYKLIADGTTFSDKMMMLK